MKLIKGTGYTILRVNRFLAFTIVHLGKRTVAQQIGLWVWSVLNLLDSLVDVLTFRFISIRMSSDFSHTEFYRKYVEKRG